MALNIRPTDALVHRLLQQNSRASDVAREAPVKSGQVADQVNISSEARRAGESRASAETYAPASRTVSYKQEELESRLLSLYSYSKESKS